MDTCDINADQQKPDLTWLVGRKIEKVEKENYSWCFMLDDRSCIATESPWRLTMADKIMVTSNDHGHFFGLSVPVDAATRAMQIVTGDPICSYELKKCTSDLVLYFTNGAIIELLNLSCGYEAWRTVHGAQEIICMGGGSISEITGR